MAYEEESSYNSSSGDFESIVIIIVLNIFLIYCYRYSCKTKQIFYKNILQNQLHLQNTIFIYNHLYTFPPLDKNWSWSMSSNFAKPKSVIFTWFGFCTATQENNNNKGISNMSQILAHKACLRTTWHNELP